MKDTSLQSGDRERGYKQGANFSKAYYRLFFNPEEKEKNALSIPEDYFISKSSLTSVRADLKMH